MPRDIRSYFLSGKANSTSTSTKASKRRIIASDDEDEISQSPLKKSKKTLPKKVAESDSENVLKKKTVSPSDIFGKSPVNREEAPKVSKKLQKKESEIHNDDDFEATLTQLDTSDIEKKYLEETRKDAHENKKKEATPVKEKRSSSKNAKHKNGSTEDVDDREDKSKKSTKKTELPNIVVEHVEKKKASPKKPDVYEEIIEKKKQHSVMYQQYLNRGGARNPGSKEVPVGAENCLAGLSFVLTGVLESLEREEAEELIKKYGGRVVHQVSKKVNYVIIGDQPGPAKVEKARSLNVTQISEDDLLELIKTRPAGQASSVQKPRARSTSKKRIISTDSEESSPPKKAKLDDEQKEASRTDEKNKSEKPSKASPKRKELNNEDLKTKSPIKVKHESKKFILDRKETMNEIASVPVQALSEKYRPKTMKQILGQQGDKSNAKKLHSWLMNWHKNQTSKTKRTKPSPYAKNDDGGFFKAALLSGPPGIGKTTTVQVVCKELGFDLVEFNASDTRSKRLLKEEVSELLSNTSLKNYFEDNKNKPSWNHVLLMDEVDGMAGNEDRGGLQELISLIKSTDIPIVCICNDRNNPKMRTLSNYTFDLKFAKPRLEQIRGAMKSVCFKENIQMSNEDLDRLIEATNQDIRQVINHLSLFVGQTGTQEKSEKKHANKDLRLGPWDVVRKVFSAEEHKHMNIHDKSDLFFHDYNISPLFVQENYLSVVPQGVPKNALLERIAMSAESIAMGDLVERAIRSNNAWSLLPTQACFSSVIPGTLMSGYIGGQINFPNWLGKNSRTGKFNRLIQEITQHARLTTGVSKEAINLDYLKPLRNAIVRPLTSSGKEDISAAVDVMNRYHLLREDLDSLIEVSLWPGDRDPMQFVDSKTKAAFTRAYNKNSAPLPYAVNATTKKRAASSQNEGEEEDALEEEANSEDDNIDADQMIKAKKPKESKNAEPKSKNEGRGKTSNKPAKRGRGRGK
ncbi:replication factor C subunit 1 isoform X2 [Ceratina calcarata]|uniref:Replication factor C subunit 1 n=1 Tax=Ceratina calcarata TaxID=156304 RepID=A0AAJ7S0Y8_9HYME|nr:replication factor C subunit 1 isoform X2 [Ceratina calcarata]